MLYTRTMQTIRSINDAFLSALNGGDGAKFPTVYGATKSELRDLCTFINRGLYFEAQATLCYTGNETVVLLPRHASAQRAAA